MPKKMSVEVIRYDLNILLSKLPDEEQKKWLTEKIRDRSYRAV